MDALAAHGKIAPPVQKKRILPLTHAITAVRQKVGEARKAEQDHRRQEKYEEWLQREDESLTTERKALRPIAKRRVAERESELRTWALEEEWVRWLQCSHLPDARSESDLNDYLTDWEKDTSRLTMQQAVEETGSSIGVMVQIEQAQILKSTLS
jgi:hypothetical protein